MKLAFLSLFFPCLLFAQSGSLVGGVSVNGGNGAGGTVVPIASGGGASPTPDLIWYKFTEGSGTTAADSSGHANTGTFGTGATWVTGASGSGFGVKGSGTVTALSSNGTVAYGTNKITICFWVNVATWGGGQQFLFNTANAFQSATVCAAFYNDGAGDSLVNLDGAFTSAQTFTNPNLPATGAWHHLALWYDNSATAGTNWVFMDSVLQAWTFSAANTGPANFATSKLYLDGYGASTKTINASIDDFRIYSGLLSSNQVSQVYADKQ